MKRILMVVGIALGACVASADDSYLWWMVDRETDAKYDYTYAVVKATTGNTATGGTQVGDGLGKGSGLQGWAYVGSAIGSGYSYYIELLSEATGTGGGYEAVAASSLASWEDLQNFFTANGVPGTSTPWTGGEFHAVPEPTSGLLLLLGVAGLALRRKRA